MLLPYNEMAVQCQMLDILEKVHSEKLELLNRFWRCLLHTEIKKELFNIFPIHHLEDKLKKSLYLQNISGLVLF